jgi:Raf kinase inhibitor-like YbhB/YbcL family protein
MFRTTVNDLNLFGGRTTAGPKPSFRPAVEALEERVLLRFALRSIAFSPGGITGPIPERNAAGPLKDNGQRTFDNLSPPLEWHNVPERTLSFALIVEDESVILPPEEGGGHFIHWVIFNIPGNARPLPEGIRLGPDVSDPRGAHQGLNGNDQFGYLGPNPQSPPPPPHTYLFTL